MIKRISAACALLSLSTLPAAAETGWLTVQMGDACPMGPGTRVLISNNGMKASSARGRIMMVTTGPSWNVFLLNNSERTVYQTSLSKWLATAQQEKSRQSLSGATWKRGSTAQIANMRAYEFIMDKPPTRPPATAGARKSLPVTTARLWVAQDIPTSPSISNLFSQLYGIPDCQRLPLRLSTGSSAAPSIRLDTVSATGVPITAQTFQVPTGYKPAKSYMEVITGSTDDEEIRKLLQD